MSRFVKKNVIVDAAHETIVDYPVSSNISYFWNFGIYAFVCLIIQILTGIYLGMNYIPEIDWAFASVERMMTDVSYGWEVRYIHANGASMFFIVVYIHMFRGLYQGSYMHPRQGVWIIGVLIFFLMIITAFLGYVLPWGQMSLWGATVITSLVSAVPFYGAEIAEWIWGGFNVGQITLNRFYSLHYFLPFLMVSLVLIHLILLHIAKSNNPLGAKSTLDNIPFTPYFSIKDFYSIIGFLIFFGLYLYFLPNDLGHPDNYTEADALLTPEHIVPEWYFLPFYAMLRTVPDKLGGVIVMLCSIIVLFILPYIHTDETKSMSKKPFGKFLFWSFVIAWLVLGWVGGQPIEPPYLMLGSICTFYYFLFFLILSLYTFDEKSIWNKLYKELKIKFNSLRK